VPSLHAALQLEGCCVSKANMTLFKLGWMSMTDQHGEAAHACRAQNITGFGYAKHGCRSKPCIHTCACYDCRFGLSSLRSSSNIFFTNGIYDPFTACGPTVNISDTITATIYGRVITQTLFRSMLSMACLLDALWHPCLMPYGILV